MSQSSDTTGGNPTVDPTGDPASQLIRVSRLGEGSYGRVYGARLASSEQEYAVKRLLTWADTNFVDSVRELDLMVLGQNHHYIIKLLGIYLNNPFSCMMSAPPRNQRDDSLWLIMPKARGSLYSLYSTFETRRFLQCHIQTLFTDLMLALEFLQEHNISHRDLKPENILVFWQDATPEDPTLPSQTVYLQLSDFGMAKPLELNGGRSSTNIMTPFYRAPEVALGCPYYNSSIDIWSAGLILHFMLTNNELFNLPNGRIFDDEIILEINRMLPLATKQYPGTPRARVRLSNSIARTSLRDRINSYYKTKTSLWPIRPDGSQLDLNQTIQLLETMICLDLNRATASEILAFPWFQQPGLQSLIQYTRSTVPHGYADFYFQTNLVPERAMIANVFIINFFNKQEQLPWYQHRIMFLAIDLADRCLASVGISSQPAFPVRWAQWQVYETNIRAELLAYSCLYLAIKYFNSKSLPIVTILPKDYLDPDWIDYLEKSEFYLIKEVFGFNIYRPNLYEVATRHDIDAVMAMLRAILKTPEQYLGQTYRGIWRQLAGQLGAQLGGQLGVQPGMVTSGGHSNQV